MQKAKDVYVSDSTKLLSADSFLTGLVTPGARIDPDAARDFRVSVDLLANDLDLDFVGRTARFDFTGVVERAWMERVTGRRGTVALSGKELPLGGGGLH